MAKIDVKTWREKSVPLRPSVVENVYFDDTFPNHLLLQNSSPFPLYMSVNPGVSSSSYDDVVPGYGIRIFARPTGTKQCYLYMQSNAVNNVYVGSWQGEFDPVTIMQTQDVISIDPTAKLGQVEVSAILTKLPAGDNLIGKVEVSNQLTVANVVTVTGEVEIKNDVGSPIPVSLPMLPAGTNNIGDVDVLTLPSLPAGTNNIGDVDVLTLPNVTLNPLPAGTNNIGDVDVLTLPPLPAGTNNIGDVDILTLPPLPAGTNNIGDVDVLTLPALPTGANTIGAVNTLLSFATQLNMASAAITTTTTGTDQAVGQYKEISLDVNISAVSGTTPTYVLSVERKGADGIYYPIWTSATQSAVGKVSIAIGLGLEINKSFGDIVRIVETLGGTTPSFTRSVSMKVKS